MNLPADLAPCPECVQGYVQETGFDRCEKCNPEPASGVEARVCETMSDRPTPLTDALWIHCVRNAGPGSGLRLAMHARDLERKLAEAREALELAAKLPTHQDCPVENHGIVVAALEAIARIDAKGKETA